MELVVLNNRYRLLEMVGSGGMAVVYRGVDLLLQRQVAVKVLRESFAGDPAFLARFQREARAAAALDHPNVVTVYDVGQDGDHHYIVMEYVRGQDLKTLIRQRGRLNVEEALSIAIQIASGVGHAHKAGVVHCDVKPQNVLVTSDGRAKVTDFGIARALSESGLTESETVWGSPLYFAPEQAAGEPPSPASDVYSIGVVMYEMLTGVPPFQAEKPAALALMHMREEPQPLAALNPLVPPQLDWIVRKLLAKEPSARYRNAEQLAHVLEEYRKHGEQATGWQPAVHPADYTRPVPPAHSPEVVPRPVEPPLPPALSQEALDRLAWVLGAIACIAVIGLFPLWGMVYQVWRPHPPPLAGTTPTPLVTLAPEERLVSVPDVVGRPVAEARAMMERAGLRFVLQEERDEPGVEGGIVLQQTPRAGEQALVGSEVAVIASRARRELIMPDIVDYQVSVVQGGLESDGLRVAIEEVWSIRPRGTVLGQEPGPGATIHAGDAVTLTVSGGVDVPIPLEVNLAGLIMLDSAELRQGTFWPGGTIELTLRWRALSPVGMRYVAFVHLVNDPNGPPLAQHDAEPTPPTISWTPGVQVVDTHRFMIPQGQPPGWYQLRVGLYPQGQPGYQLPVIDPGRTRVDSGRILVAEIEVR